MRYSDQWVRDGRRLEDKLIDLERAALVRSYAALLAGVHRESGQTPPGRSSSTTS
jgi:hypothetical protein